MATRTVASQLAILKTELNLIKKDQDELKWDLEDSKGKTTLVDEVKKQGVEILSIKKSLKQLKIDSTVDTKILEKIELLRDKRVDNLKLQNRELQKKVITLEEITNRSLPQLKDFQMRYNEFSHKFSNFDELLQKLSKLDKQMKNIGDIVTNNQEIICRFESFMEHYNLNNEEKDTSKDEDTSDENTSKDEDTSEENEEYTVRGRCGISSDEDISSSSEVPLRESITEDCVNNLETYVNTEKSDKTHKQFFFKTGGLIREADMSLNVKLPKVDNLDNEIGEHNKEN